MAKFRININGGIAGIKKRFKAGIYETNNLENIEILRSMKKTYVNEIIEPELISEPVPEIPAPIPKKNPPVKNKKEVKPIGKHHHTTR